MKKILLLSAIICTASLAQTLLFEENFDYPEGTLTSLDSNWVENPTGSSDIQVIAGNLSFTNYQSSGIGNKIVLDGGATGRSGVIHSFSPQSGNGSTVYFSFLLNVTGTADMDSSTTDGDYFVHFNGTQIKNRITVRQGSDSTKYSIGLAKTTSSSSLVWYGNELDIDSTYLIVTSYHFIAGNDEARLWINPDLSGSEPLPDISVTSGADADTLYQIQFRQNSKSGDMEIDGLRVSDSWAQAPLPVELTSFSAIIIKEGIELNWRTETEVNNYGFEIQRLEEFKNSELQNWKVIGFVEGYGNSNSPKEYNFLDENIHSGYYSYRLKQIDNDGQFEYSKIVEINIDVPAEFTLEQNYPNPFNPTTSLQYAISRGQLVTLIVYDVLGREIAKLVDEFKPAGKYVIEFDGSNLTSGIYFYRLEAGSFIQVRKMVLAK